MARRFLKIIGIMVAALLLAAVVTVAGFRFAAWIREERRPRHARTSNRPAGPDHVRSALPAGCRSAPRRAGGVISRHGGLERTVARTITALTYTRAAQAARVHVTDSGSPQLTSPDVQLSITVGTPPISVSLSESSAFVVLNGSKNFIATVLYDPQNGNVDWTLSLNGMPCTVTVCGSISPATTASRGANSSHGSCECSARKHHAYRNNSRWHSTSNLQWCHHHFCAWFYRHWKHGDAPQWPHRGLAQ